MDSIRDHHQDNQDSEAGFTLIELLTVVMIIGVLIAVMLPNFLQARQPAQDRQAQTLLRTGVTAARTVATSDATLPTATTLSTIEPEMAFVDDTTVAEAKAKSVSVGAGSTGTSWYLIMTSHSSSGRCFAVLEQADSATTVPAARHHRLPGRHVQSRGRLDHDLVITRVPGPRSHRQ